MLELQGGGEELPALGLPRPEEQLHEERLDGDELPQLGVRPQQPGEQPHEEQPHGDELPQVGMRPPQ